MPSDWDVVATKPASTKEKSLAQAKITVEKAKARTTAIKSPRAKSTGSGSGWDVVSTTPIAKQPQQPKQSQQPSQAKQAKPSTTPTSLWKDTVSKVSRAWHASPVYHSLAEVSTRLSEMPNEIQAQADALVPEQTKHPTAARIYKNVIAPGGKASARYLASITDPNQSAMMLAFHLVPVTGAGRVLHMALGAYFTGQMGLDGLKQTYQSYKAAAGGNTPQAVERGMDALFSLGTAAEGSKGAREGIKTLGRAAGRVTAPARAKAAEKIRPTIQRTLGAGPQLAGQIGTNYEKALTAHRTRKAELRERAAAQSERDVASRRQAFEQAQTAAQQTATEANRRIEEQNREVRERDISQAQVESAKRTKEYQQSVKEAQQEADRKNTEAQAKYERDLTEVQEYNSRIEETLAHRQDIQDQFNSATRDLHDRVVKAEEDAKAREKTAWGTVDEKVAEAKKSGEVQDISGSGIVDAIRKAEDSSLHGTSPENIRTFHSMISDLLRKVEEEPELGKPKPLPGAAPSTPSALWMAFRDAVETTQQGSEVSAIVPPGMPTPGVAKEVPDVPFDKVHGWVTELGYEISRYPREAPQDVKTAMIAVRNYLTKQMNQVAEDAGAGDDLDAARQATIQRHQAFSRERPEVQSAARKYEEEMSGSQKTRERAASEREKTLASLDPDIAVQGRKVAELRNRLDSIEAEDVLRKRLKAPPDKPVPVKPEPVEPPVEVSRITPLRTADVQPAAVQRQPEVSQIPEGYYEKSPELASLYKAREQNLRTSIDQLQRVRPWEWAGLLAGGVKSIKALLGVGNLAWAATVPLYLLGRHLIMTRAEKDDAIRWIAQPTTADLKAIAHLPEEIQTPLKAEINGLIMEETTRRAQENASRKIMSTKPVRVNPLLRVWLNQSQISSGQANQSDQSGQTNQMGPYTPSPGTETETNPSGLPDTQGSSNPSDDLDNLYNSLGQTDQDNSSSENSLEGGAGQYGDGGGE